MVSYRSAVLLLGLGLPCLEAYVSVPLRPAAAPARTRACQVSMVEENSSRRQFISIAAGSAVGMLALGQADRADALVKGLAPPPDFGKR